MNLRAGWVVANLRLFTLQSTMTWEGNTLVHDQKGQKDTVLRRTFEGDAMTLVRGFPFRIRLPGVSRGSTCIGRLKRL